MFAINFGTGTRNEAIQRNPISPTIADALQDFLPSWATYIPGGWRRIGQAIPHMTNHTVLGASGASTPQSVHSSWPKDYGWALPMGIVRLAQRDARAEACRSGLDSRCAAVDNQVCSRDVGAEPRCEESSYPCHFLWIAWPF